MQLYFLHACLLCTLQTYNVDRQVPDSAGTATALFSGVKGNYYTVGLDSHGIFNVCSPEAEEKAKVSTLLDWAISAGKSTGMFIIIIYLIIYISLLLWHTRYIYFSLSTNIKKIIHVLKRTSFPHF